MTSLIFALEVSYVSLVSTTANWQ